MRAMKTIAISVLGTQKDAHGGAGPARWDTWRPTIGLVQQESLPIDELHLILNKEFLPPTETLGDWMDRGLNEEKPTEQELRDDWGGLDS